MAIALQSGPHRNDVSSRRGAVAAEFALLLPLLLLVIFATMQLGLLYQRSEATQAAAREAARYASTPNSTSTIACDRASSSLSGTSFTATPTCQIVGDCSNGATTVVATITVANSLEIPFWGSSNITLTGRGEFACE